MLVKIVFFLVCLLITVSCSSISDDYEEIASRFSQDGEALIKEALDTPEISSQFTSSSHVILSSIASKNKFAMPFYDFAVQTYDFNYFGFDSEDPQSWNAFVNCPFRDFSSQQPDQAQDIINQIVLPSHPFLSQVPFKLHTADFLNQMILDLDTYLDKVAKDIFIQQFSQILALEDHSEAQILLKDLIHKAKDTSFPDPEFKYHHAFLANVPFDYFKKINYCHPEHHNSINTFISQLAPILYSEIAEDSKQLADKILSGLLPSIYSTLTDTSYENSIGKYQESLLQPIDKSYLWDQQEFQVDLLEALQALTIVENPNFPPYLIIIKWLSNVSSLNHLFNHYIVQNFCKPSYLSPRDQPLFWRSLIFSSFTDFSAIFPCHSSQIIEKSQLLPSLDEEKLLFVYGLLDEQFTSKNHFYILSDWGHKSTIELLLQSHTDISADHVGSALEHAARSGYSSIVELLLQRRTDIHEFHVGCALYNASEGGHASTVDLLLQRCTNISADHVGWALKKAAESGYKHIVELLLQSDAEIAADHIGWALQNATKGGYTSVVNRLLQYCNHIPADHVGLALRSVAESGHTHIVELLLQSDAEIAADHIGWALQNATKGGYTSVVNRLLQYCNHIPADHVGLALRNVAKSGHTHIVEQLLRRNTELPADYIRFALNSAARGGHTSIVELFLQRRTDISADDVGCALSQAVLDHHTSTVEFLLQRCTDIPAEDVVVAFRNSVYYVRTSIVDLLLQRRTDIPDFCVVEALLEAANSGDTVIVELLLQRRADSVSNFIGQALHKAAEGGHTSTFELLRRHLAGEMLFRLLPSIYSNLIDTNYENAIRKYQESLIQPINKSYCWDPKLFDDLLLKGLRALSFIENHSSPPYLKVLEFISKYSPLARLFRDYISQNFRKPFDLRTQHVYVFFWRSLIFSSFIVFSSLFPDHSRQILKHLQLLPSLDEVRPLFLHGLLDDQLSYKDNFLLVSGWGHTLTVDLLLQFRTDISPDDVGKALRDAASGGHTSTVELLLKRRTDISSDYVGWALRDAVFFGHILIVELLLQSRTDISADYSGEALKNAAQNGNSSIVELIIQRCTYIHVYYFGLALSGASGNGHTLIVQDLFHRRSDINPTEFSCALVSAAENGHTSTVEFLLKHRTDIPAGFVGWALCNAAKGGYSLIVKLLLQYRNDIDVNHVRSALKDAARDGHTSIVDLLRQYQLKNDL